MQHIYNFAIILKVSDVYNNDNVSDNYTSTKYVTVTFKFSYFSSFVITDNQIYIYILRNWRCLIKVHKKFYKAYTRCIVKLLISTIIRLSSTKHPAWIRRACSTAARHSIQYPCAKLPVYKRGWPCSLSSSRRSTDSDALRRPVLLSEQYP